ncbi:MAG: transporter substrate-binding domain-containing protein [Bacteroidetes bacterium]|nr:transporter substrate-binding domain-containing protein [Bacteroidota bacterium]
MKRSLLYNWLIFPLLSLSLIISVAFFYKDEIRDFVYGKEVERINTLELIQQSGKLTALIDYNSTNYFIYRGQPMGYQFELLKAFTEHLGVKLEIVTNNNLEESFRKLQDREVDIIATGLTITNERNQFIDFTDPLNQTVQVLVQRKPENWRKLETNDEIESRLIRNPLQLAGKTIVIQKTSSFKGRLENLSNEIGQTINIIEDDNREVEQLITAVALGEIDYTISDEHIALVNQNFHPDIDVNTAVSFPQNIAWGIRLRDDDFKRELNNWLNEFKNTYTARLLYNKYFKNPRTVNYARSEFHTIGGGKISKYDEIIKDISAKYGMDWKLLSSIVYQESGFRTQVESWRGAFGLMQLMPETAEIFGIDSLSSPSEQIEAGVKYMHWLDTQFKDVVSDSLERKKFVLAAYNVGLGHIWDARRLAEKYDRDPNVWTNNVDTFLLQKSNPVYYRDSVVRYGYCRGSEPYNFVVEILDRYNHYSNLIKN